MTVGKLILSHRLAKRELQDAGARQDVIAAWRKSIFAEMPAKGISGCRLLKAYVTTRRGPRRTLYLLQNGSGDTIFLMHRPKGDPIGDNMSYGNPSFKAAIDKAMIIARDDIMAKAYDIEER